MKSSAILREAARLVERCEDTGDHYAFPVYGCFAIKAAIEGLHSSWYAADEDDGIIAKPMAHFKKLRPDATGSKGWFDEDFGARIIGLCLAAAIAESEGD